MLHKTFLVVFLSLLFISTVWAEMVTTDPYASEVPVENQSPELRQQAIREAFEDVLNKVADMREVRVTRDVLDKSLRRADRYVQQYRYTEQGLWVRFDNQAVDELLQQDLDNSAILHEDILLEVTGIHSLPDYVQVANYLASLKFLYDAQPRVVAPDSTIFQIKARNSQAAVAQAIARDGFLQRTDGDTQVPSFHYSP